jgi:hypothetical protein
MESHYHRLLMQLALANVSTTLHGTLLFDFFLFSGFWRFYYRLIYNSADTVVPRTSVARKRMVIIYVSLYIGGNT